jgi:hypothetical protein
VETCDAGLSNYLLFIIILELSWAFEVLKQPTLNFTNLLVTRWRLALTLAVL